MCGQKLRGGMRRYHDSCLFGVKNPLREQIRLYAWDEYWKSLP